MTTNTLAKSAPTPVRILGREPVAWIGLAEAALILFASFGLGWEAHTQAWLAVLTAAFGVYTAWAIKDTLLGVIVGLVKSLLVLIAVYGFEFSDQQTGAIIAATTMLVTFFERTQTSPEHFPASPSYTTVVVQGTVVPGETDDPVDWKAAGNGG